MHRICRLFDLRSLLRNAPPASWKTSTTDDLTASLVG
ncbi:Protein of unknown function [Gryllus bimaculatus]|nr:Protein of unknown function [Gryllus bimaculatus]